LTGYFGSAASNSPPPPQTLPAEKECKRVFSVTTPSLFVFVQEARVRHV
jgi:hypothetical protein